MHCKLDHVLVHTPNLKIVPLPKNSPTCNENNDALILFFFSQNWSTFSQQVRNFGRSWQSRSDWTNAFQGVRAPISRTLKWLKWPQWLHARICPMARRRCRSSSGACTRKKHWCNRLMTSKNEKNDPWVFVSVFVIFLFFRELLLSYVFIRLIQLLRKCKKKIPSPPKSES